MRATIRIYFFQSVSLSMKYLEEIIADISFTCKATIEDLVLPQTLSCVAVRFHHCSDAST